MRGEKNTVDQSNQEGFYFGLRMFFYLRDPRKFHLAGVLLHSKSYVSMNQRGLEGMGTGQIEKV